MNGVRNFFENLALRRKGFKWLGLVLAANAVLFVGVTHRLANKQDRLARELERLALEVQQKQNELEQVAAAAERAETNAEIVASFWEETVKSRAPGLTDAWDEIDRLASETNVVRGRTGYDRELLDVGLERIHASMPVEGNYFDLVRFINRLERSDRFFLVEEVRLSKRDSEDDTIHLDCGLSFYLNPVAEGGD